MMYCVGHSPVSARAAENSLTTVQNSIQEVRIRLNWLDIKLIITSLYKKLIYNGSTHWQLTQLVPS